jgi:hypothetical protein
MESFPGNTVRLSNLVHSNPDIRTRTYRAGSNLELQNAEAFITLQRIAKSLEPQS